MDDGKSTTTDGTINSVGLKKDASTTQRTALDIALKDSTLTISQQFDGPYDKRLYYNWGRVKLHEERIWLELCKSVTPRDIAFGGDWSVGEESKLWDTSWDSSTEAELQKTPVEEIELYRRTAVIFNSEPSILFPVDIKSGKYPLRFPVERRRSQHINVPQMVRDFNLNAAVAQKLGKLICNPCFQERLDFFHFVLCCVIKARAGPGTEVSQPRIRQRKLQLIDQKA